MTFIPRRDDRISYNDQQYASYGIEKDPYYENESSFGISFSEEDKEQALAKIFIGIPLFSVGSVATISTLSSFSFISLSTLKSVCLGTTIGTLFSVSLLVVQVVENYFRTEVAPIIEIIAGLGLTILSTMLVSYMARLPLTSLQVIGCVSATIPGIFITILASMAITHITLIFFKIHGIPAPTLG
jgi:hypothetical protein